MLTYFFGQTNVEKIVSPDSIDILMVLIVPLNELKADSMAAMLVVISLTSPWSSWSCCSVFPRVFAYEVSKDVLAFEIASLRAVSSDLNPLSKVADLSDLMGYVVSCQ